MQLEFVKLLSLSLLTLLSTSLAANADSKSTTPSGLQIENLHTVECKRRTTKGDTVEMHYRGSLASDGSEFDASYNRGRPLVFPVGGGRVIKGWVSFFPPQHLLPHFLNTSSLERQLYIYIYIPLSDFTFWAVKYCFLFNY